ncbi:hypothetical protein KAI87_03040 [Myxococcota bacterium]|nr:hypothetical protein [Myxococcota bacterium]
MKKYASVLALAFLFLSSCNQDVDPIAPPSEADSCDLVGEYLVGTPIAMVGSCPEHLIVPQIVRTELDDIPGHLKVYFGNYQLEANFGDDCILHASGENLVINGASVALKATININRGRFEATVEEEAPDICDMRYLLLGREVETDGDGAPLGESCGDVLDCDSGACAYGETAGCLYGVCVSHGTDNSYCSEPCYLGTCPAGYSCTDFEDAVSNTQGSMFCVATGALCGDFVVTGDEVCDDGNQRGGDGCSADCDSLERCGNDLIDLAAGELCDDGNSVSGDGCSSECQLEACGNSVEDGDEQCDDGNQVAGDGCSPSCRLEACGNGALDAFEGCDDGNTFSADACDGECRARFVNGVAPAYPMWVRSLSGGESVSIQNNIVIEYKENIAIFTTELYGEASPFDSRIEVYMSELADGGAALEPAVRLENLHSWTMESATTDAGGTNIMALMRKGNELGLSKGATAAAMSEPVIFEPSSAPADLVLHFASLHKAHGYYHLLAGLESADSSGGVYLYYARSTNGLTWSDWRQLTQSVTTESVASRPLFAADEAGNVAVVWAEGSADSGQLVSVRSRDDGTTFFAAHDILGEHASGRTSKTQASLILSGRGFQLAWSAPSGVQSALWKSSEDAWQMTTVASDADLGVANVGNVALCSGRSGDSNLFFSADHTVLNSDDSTGAMMFSSPQGVGSNVDELSIQHAGPMGVVVESDGGGLLDDVVSLLYTFNINIEGGSAYVPVLTQSRDGGFTFSEEPLLLESIAGSEVVDISGFKMNDRPYFLITFAEGAWLIDLHRLSTAAPEARQNTAGSDCTAAITEGGWCQYPSFSSPLARSGADFVELTSGDLALFGGLGNAGRLADGAVYNQATGSWRHFDAGAYPVSAWGREGHITKAVGDKVLVFGGTNGFISLGDGLVIDLSTSEAQISRMSMTDAPSARTGHAAVVVNGKLIILGGQDADGQPLADGAVYREGSDSWSPPLALPIPLSYLSATVVGEDVYLFGGQTTDGLASSKLYKLDADLSSDTVWEITEITAAGGPSARWGHRAAYSEGWPVPKLMVWGGVDSAQVLSDGALFDPATSTWSSLASSTQIGVGYGDVYLGTHWVIWGGMGDVSQSFSLLDEQWTVLPAGQPEHRIESALLPLGSGMLVFGGRNMTGESSSDLNLVVP